MKRGGRLSSAKVLKWERLVRELEDELSKDAQLTLSVIFLEILALGVSVGAGVVGTIWWLT